MDFYSANISQAQIFVNGWKQIYASSDNKIIFYANGNTGLVKVVINKTINYSQSNIVLPEGTISSQYRPLHTVTYIFSDVEPIGQFEFENTGRLCYYGFYDDESQDPGYQLVSTVITYAYG